MFTLMLLMFVTMVRSQDTTPDYTVTYIPIPDFCLPYDGSVVPDCKKFGDPISKRPYFHEHSTSKIPLYENLPLFFYADCSRFWECGPNGESCLLECANCQHAIGENANCAGRWALSFDVRFQYPDGPVCMWPRHIDCSAAVCDEMDPRPECCQNSDCQNVGSDDYCPDAYCSTNFNCLNTCQEETTTPDYTVTYNPGQECLPYDGSVVPDCSKFWDPITKYPYYHEHSTSKISTP